MDRSNSDMMTGQQKRTLDPESANPAKRLKTSHIPDQLRHLIWHELRCTGASGEGAAIATTPYLSMSDNEYVQENQKIVEGEKVVELVNQDRSESYQGRPDEYDPNSIAEYCSEVCGSYIFVFKTSGGLDRFAQLVQTTLSVKPNLVFHPEGIELDIFEGKEFESMAGWRKAKTAYHHGYFEKAERHLKQSMGIVQKLPLIVPVRLVLKQAWRDYENLHGAMRKGLRDGIMSRFGQKRVCGKSIQMI